MSLSEVRGITKSGKPVSWAAGRTVTAMALILFAVALSGCGNGSGLRPLYGPSAGSGQKLSEKLAEVRITKIPGRVGQKLRNELIFQTTGGNYADSPNYRLRIIVRERVTSTLVQRTGESLAQVYNLDAVFELTDLKTKKIILKGNSYGRAGFERFVSAFSNVRARRDAEDRAAKTVAVDIQSRISAFLATNT